MAAHCQPEGARDAAAQDPHNGAADFTSLSFPSFVETMCRLSWVLHPGFRTLPEKFEQCVRQQVRPHARKDSRDVMQTQVGYFCSYACRIYDLFAATELSNATRRLFVLSNGDFSKGGSRSCTDGLGIR